MMLVHFASVCYTQIHASYTYTYYTIQYIQAVCQGKMSFEWIGNVNEDLVCEAEMTDVKATNFW
jgi:hypothetical protein